MKRNFTVCLLFLLPLTVLAQIPRTLSYQGVLTDNTGKPRTDGNYAFTFRLYNTVSGGTAIWSEQKTLPIKVGLFSTALGDNTPFGPVVKFDRPYWLSIQVGNEPELAPRIALTSVGYSMSALRADTASFSVASLADTTWRHSGANIYRLNGNVGIGTDNPETNSRLHILGRITVQGNQSAALFKNSLGSDHFLIGLRSDISPDDFVFHSYGAKWIFSTGNVGIGTTKPYAFSKLYVESGVENDNAIQGVSTKPGGAGVVGYSQHPDGIGGYFDNSAGGLSLWATGRAKVAVLEITGGSDLAEPFEISHDEKLPAGALVVIDKDNPGKLKLATEPYDKRVAGVISGAGGVNPGLTLSQEGVLAGGQHVALTGKVYALATAANGAIESGDLLTTSNVPGHAMKASDQARWPGAVIGKAMSSLNEGEGLVLVLVNLQ